MNAEIERMAIDGKATLYVTEDRKARTCTVTDWDDSVSFPCGAPRRSWHNIGGERIDFWFVGPDERGDMVAIWHGYQIGDFNTIAHCARTKGRTSK